MQKNWTIEELQAMTGNTIEMTENNMKLLENSMKQLQEFQKTLGRTDIQETMKAYEKVSEQTEQEQERKQDNKNKYTYDEISKEIDRIIDTATKENPLLKHILNHSYDIAKAYTLINFDNEVKEEYEFDRIDNDDESIYNGNRMYSNLADCFYTSSVVNEHSTIDIIKALIIAIINNDWCFIADIYFNNMNSIKAQGYLYNAARLSLDSKAYHKTKHSNT